MVSGERVIRWGNAATNGLISAVNHIMKDSPQNAAKVNNDLLSKVYDLPTNPEKYPLGKYKQNNDGTYRAFEQHHYRVAYRIMQDQIRIISVRHTSMEPKQH